MKKIIFIALMMTLTAFSMSAKANYTNGNPPPCDGETDCFKYKPSQADMYDLDHYKYYKWKINLTLAGYTIGTPITEATLTFHNINNWDDNPNVLYIHLLNTSSGNSLTSGTDNQGGGDYFAGKGVLIEAWHDDDGYPGPAEDLVYTFSLLPDGRNILPDLNNYASDGYIAFGIDPDCHYWNDGVKFKICTTPTIPAPGAVLLGGIGVSIVGWLRRRRTL